MIDEVIRAEGRDDEDGPSFFLDLLFQNGGIGGDDHWQTGLVLAVSAHRQGLHVGEMRQTTC